ncbi:hypothetical protein B0H10DRAFT_2199338 [Mycena sp. CBHHK59/15]|nr:hypothetical protein B0H10DRAFT_2199338 [Mycena sp. CBHHK59/15]
MDNHIMSEQEGVRGLQIVFLKTQTRLTLPFDGGAVRRGEYFYTFHANTADGRSFLLEGLDCTGVSHTAQWMAKAAMEVMNYVAVENFIGASSDSTGNTKGCRRILCEQVPTFLDLPDPNHHLSLTCKDILLLPFFKLPIKIVRATVIVCQTFQEVKRLEEDAQISAPRTEDRPRSREYREDALRQRLPNWT